MVMLLIKVTVDPLGLLPAISKLFEKLYAEQINKYTHNYFSKYLCGLEED